MSHAELGKLTLGLARTEVMGIQYLSIRLEAILCKIGLLQTPDWQTFLANEDRRLYAGFLPSDFPQAKRGFVGLTPFQSGIHNIAHDLRVSMPIPDETVSLYQAEDVFEHIDLEHIPGIIRDIHRTLMIGGLFRFSVPDYNFSYYKARAQRDESGKLLFDPGGGGELSNGKVIKGGHVWFPTIGMVKTLFDGSPFSDVRYRQYYTSNGEPHVEVIEHSLAHVRRSAENDPRGNGNPVSIIVDAIK